MTVNHAGGQLGGKEGEGKKEGVNRQVTRMQSDHHSVDNQLRLAFTPALPPQRLVLVPGSIRKGPEIQANGETRQGGASVGFRTRSQYGAPVPSALSGQTRPGAHLSAAARSFLTNGRLVRLETLPEEKRCRQWDGTRTSMSQSPSPAFAESGHRPAIIPSKLMRQKMSSYRAVVFTGDCCDGLMQQQPPQQD